LRKIRINNTDFEFDALSLGTVNAGLDWDNEDAYAIYESYLENGGTLIDTARAYSNWVPGEKSRSERVMSDWLRKRGKRNDFILSSKGGHPYPDTPDVMRISRSEMEEDIHASLEHLGVDQIDIYFYHRDDTTYSVEYLIETMEEFKRQGKIREYACSNWATARMKEADEYCKLKGYRGFVANQALFNLATKDMKPFADPTMIVCDEEMLEYHRNSDNILMPYMSICSGFFHKLKDEGHEVVKDSPYYTKENLKLAEKIYDLCERKDYTITQALLGYFMVLDVGTIPLISVDNLEQLDELNKVRNIEYDPKDYEFLKC
jgi:aryl-alcohol dehydrogenase-like predicted oxidoreductase